MSPKKVQYNSGTNAIKEQRIFSDPQLLPSKLPSDSVFEAISSNNRLYLNALESKNFKFIQR